MLGGVLSRPSNFFCAIASSLGIAILWAASGVGLGNSVGPAKNPPNVVFIIVDDASTRTVSATGGAWAKTPNIDQLAARGVVIENTYLMGAFSGAICTVSRAMILTGRPVWSVTPGNFKYGGPASLKTEDTLMPELFRQHGYQSFGTGKWHNGNPALRRCFDFAEDIASGMLPYNSRDRGGSKDNKIELGQLNPDVRRVDGASGEITRGQAKGWSTDVYFDAAEHFLTEQRDPDKPFFLYLATNAPHDPRHESAEYLARFDAEGIPLPPNHKLQHGFDTGDMKVRDEMVFPAPHAADQVQREFATYLAMVARVDDRVGQLIELLDKQDELENTIVVFTSDHGLSMGEQGLMGKQNLYEASWKVPMIISGPGVAEGETRNGFAYLHGIYPTLCELTGLPVPSHAERFSYSRLLDAADEGQEFLFGAYTPNAESDRGIRCVREGRWKLIRYLHNGKQQLFDLEKDPWEQHDLVGVESRTETVKRLGATLNQWMAESGDPQKQ